MWFSREGKRYHPGEPFELEEGQKPSKSMTVVADDAAPVKKAPKQQSETLAQHGRRGSKTFVEAMKDPD